MAYARFIRFVQLTAVVHLPEITCPLGVIYMIYRLEMRFALARISPNPGTRETIFFWNFQFAQKSHSGLCKEEVWIFLCMMPLFWWFPRREKYQFLVFFKLPEVSCAVGTSGQVKFIFVIFDLIMLLFWRWLWLCKFDSYNTFWNAHVFLP